MKSSILLFLLSFILLVPTYCQPNTKVIDYTLFSTTNCNAFSNGSTIGLPIQGYTHYPSYGQPKSSSVLIGTTSTHVIELDNKYVTQNMVPIPYGTLYTITYPFKIGYKYTVTINAGAIATDGMSYPSLYLSLDNTSYAYSTACNGAAQFNPSGTYFVTSKTFKDYSITDFVSPFNNGQIAIESQPNGNSSPSQLYIKSVTIVETPSTPQPSFTLPSTINVICGSDISQTFMITNVNNTPNVTSYVWNLTSANNGWNYNNTSAPQNISTSTNSITFTPICGEVQQNVSAVVNVGGVNYSTNTSTVTVTPPALSITGFSTIGTNSVPYNIANLPCEASVNWSVSPSGIVTSPSCTNCTSTNISGLIDGTATLKAIVTSCGISQTIYKTIYVCTSVGAVPGNLTGTISWPTSYYYGYNLNFTPVSNATQYYMEWFDLTDNKSIVSNYVISSPGEFFYQFPQGHTFKYRLSSNASCTGGAMSDWSNPLLPPPASCTAGPISSTLSYTIGCGGSSGCTYTNLSWPAIVGASQYKVNYSIQNVSAGTIGASGIISTSSPSLTVNFPALIGTGWTLIYKVSANCSGTFGNYSGYSSRFFIQ